MNNHIVQAYAGELKDIENMVAQMGGMVEVQIKEAVTALVTGDAALAQKVRTADKKIDALEQDVDAAVIRILALRQPKAQDLRAVVAVLKIAANLERVGDYAKNIAKRSTVLGETLPASSSAGIIKRMSGLVQDMLRDVLDAYAARDIALADDVRLRDEEVDQMHNTLFRELLTYMMEDQKTITTCMHLLFIGKNIERMGDHITGISEQIHYLVSGEIPDDERPKGDVTSTTMMD